MIDLEKEREEFENVYHVDGAHYEKQGGYYSTPQDPNDDGFEVEYRWDAWLERAELAQQEMTELKAKLAKYESDEKLDKPARVGGFVFREGISNKTVIECAQRLYLSEKKEKTESVLSPSVLMKISLGELVVVPREPNEKIKNAIDVAIKKANLEKFYSQDSMIHSKSGLVYKAIIDSGEIK